MSDTATVSVDANPSEAPATAPEKPVNTDTFTNCTTRCTRRAWNIFLEYREPITLFKTKEVRGKLTFKTEAAATEASAILTGEGGVKYITQTANVLEFTGTLAAVQLVLKLPNTTLFDAVKVE